MNLKNKLEAKGQKKILSLDGGGIRGIITIEILAQIEKELREKYENPNMKLSDYFDFVAGTSTGALVGVLVSMGKSVDEIRDFYLDNGANMFQRYAVVPQLGKLMGGYEYSDKALAKIIKKIVGAETTLGTKKLKTLFMLVMHNAQSDSPWPVSNNPKAKYNDLEKNGEKSNLHLPLWKLLRASTAAPTYFPPEKIIIGDEKFIFMDGAITPFNNPAFQAYLMSTLDVYNLNWEKGEKQMLIVSVGTGQVALKQPFLKLNEMNILHHAQTVPTHLINSIEFQQDMLCRSFGKCIVGNKLDGEIGDLVEDGGLGAVDKKLFSYIRYNPCLDREGLDALGLEHIEPEEVSNLDDVHNVQTMREVGKAMAKHWVRGEHFEGFWEKSK